MNFNSYPYSSSNTTDYRRLQNCTGPYIIKIFDTKGRKIKTLSFNSILAEQEFKSKTTDLEKGVYVLNAFQRESFVKSFRIVKD